MKEENLKETKWDKKFRKRELINESRANHFCTLLVLLLGKPSSNMYFSSIPDTVFLQIFRQLPFKDRVRLGCLNGNFYRMSKIAISETKSLDLGDKIFERLTPHSLSTLLDQCAKNIERIRISDRPDSSAVLDTLAQNSCPHLFELVVEARAMRFPNNLFDLLIQKYENLRTLTWHADNPYFLGLIRERLKILHLRKCNNVALYSLVGRFQIWKIFRHGLNRPCGDRNLIMGPAGL